MLVQFVNKSNTILIATDVAARGIDIKELPHVVSLELSPAPEIYLHRIVRAGNTGLTPNVVAPSPS